MMPLLTVDNLKTHFFTDDGIIKAVDGISFTLDRGESLGIVGESGCGKSMTALSILRLIPEPPGKIVGGRVLHTPEGETPRDLLTLSKRQMRKVRGKRIAMIFQEPMTSLNPLYTIGNQIEEMIVEHETVSKREARTRGIDMLKLVGIPAPDRRVDDYPHQLSGGMRQRAMIAMALACNPDILIADEPTTALDVTVQSQILDLIASLQERFGMALLLITHDLGVVAEVTKRMIVMYAGQFVEEGKTEEVFHHPQHPYTEGLLQSLRPKFQAGARPTFVTIPGKVPSLAHLPHGCYFQDRCYKVREHCRTHPVPVDPCNVGRLVRCFYAE